MRDAQVARLPRLGEPAELADLQVHHVHREVGVRRAAASRDVDVLVEHERVRRVPAHGRHSS
jgi:hypothetical protein